MDIIILSDIFLVSVAFIAIIFATVTDLRKREVPNWLSFSILAIAFASRLIVSIITNQWSHTLYALLAFVIFFLISNALYYMKLFGGGDSKLLMALAVVFATSPSIMPLFPLNTFSEPFLLSFIVNLVTLGSVYSLIFSLALMTMHFSRFKSEFKAIHKEARNIRIFFYILSVLLLALSFWFSLLFPLFLICLFFPYLYLFMKAIENASMIKQVSPRSLTEGDWLLDKIRIKGKMIKPSAHGLNADEIKLLRHANKKVIIKYGIPFIPAFLIAFICTVLFGDILLTLILRIVF